MPQLTAHAQTERPASRDSLVEAIIYTTLGPPNWDIYLFDGPEAEPRRLTDDPARDYNAVFSPDGRWVVFTSERAGNANLYALDLETGGEPVPLTRSEAMDDAAAFSPAGRRPRSPVWAATMVPSDIVSIQPDGSDSRVESGALESCFAPDFDSGSVRMLCHGPGPVDDSEWHTVASRMAPGLVLPEEGRAFAPPGANRRVELPDRALMVRGIRGFFPALTPAGEVISTLGGISADATRAGLTEAMTEPLYISTVDGGG